jgi:Mg/Co/Ni transporter MgtE
MGAGEEESTPLLLVHKDFDVIVNHQEENDFVLKMNSSRSKTNILRRIATFDDSDIDSIFSDLRSQEESSCVGISCDADKYATCNPFQRAFPERSFALVVTLLLELPTLFFISGGSDQLCFLIGRKKYTTLISLLPLTSAISGNVGLQASTLTTRAISHLHVRKDNYFSWLMNEIAAAIYLGFVIGLVMAIIAFAMGGYNYAFAFSIFFAQFIGIATAGCTGTFAPLLFTFIFHRDSGKWGGPLETAVQDIVGSFAMIVVTYQIMQFFGPFDIEPTDICGSGG